jgi:hypothetical protein
VSSIANFNLTHLLDLTVGVVVAFVLATLIGAERQWRQRSAGLRTNVLVAVGAAAFVSLGVHLNGNAGATQIAAWRRAIELSLGNEDAAELRTIAQARTELASRVERARILLAYREDPSFFAVGRALGLHHQTDSAASSGPSWKVRWRRSKIVRVLAGNRGSRSRPRLGSCRWRAARRRTSVTPMNCGRPGFWLVMRASTDRRKDMRAWSIWRRARFARFWIRKK